MKAITSFKPGNSQANRQPQGFPKEVGRIELSTPELALLKKLDTIKYNDRTEAKVSGMLSVDEKKALQSLISKKAVSLFKKEDASRYSITKSVYDRFLYGKREENLESKEPEQGRSVEKAA